LIRLLAAALLSLFALFAGAHPACAAAEGERVTEFASDITILRDGALEISERIEVVSEGIAIRHGIFRDFPTTYLDSAGNRRRVGFEVQSVTRDGRAEPYVVETIANGRRVRIGSDVALLPPGQHIYEIHYRTDRQIGFFEQHDELYWNVTGYWDFPIAAAEVVVHAPGPITRHDFFTGPIGSAGKNAVPTQLAADTLRVRSAPLAPEESLLVAVAFPKGAVVPPTTLQLAFDVLGDNATVLAALVGLIALFAYYLIAWLYFGRDPARGVIMPLFAPPKGFSAAALRFVDRMGFDQKTFAATLIEMAVKGYITISEESDVYTLTRTGKSEDDARLVSAERAVARHLFADGDAIELRHVNHRTIRKALGALQTTLQIEDEGTYFVTNRIWFIGGLALLALSAGAVALFSDVPEETAIILVGLTLWSAVSSTALYHMVEAWRAAFGMSQRFRHFAAAIWATLAAAAFVAPLVFGVYALREALPIVALGAIVLQGMLAVLFYQLLKAPTAAGAKIRDQIDGFQMFLETAERERLEVLHPPDVTPELFQKYLPYAIALDAENEWGAKFEAEAARAGIPPDQVNRPPTWYHGGSFQRLGTTRFASSIGNAVAGAAAASATPPGSRSAFGGGRSGGGGFGGGGRGGGW
jgi:hypothetical protein